MATTITGKLNKAATQFQAGDSTGFGLRLGVKYYDRETKTDQYTNFEAAIFAKNHAQVDFYQSALVEGAIVEVTCDKIKIRQYQGQNGLSLSIEMLDAKLGYVMNPNQAPRQQAPQQGFNQQQSQAQQQLQRQRQAPPAGYQGQMPQQWYNQPQRGFNQPQNFDDDINF